MDSYAREPVQQSPRRRRIRRRKIVTTTGVAAAAAVAALVTGCATSAGPRSAPTVTITGAAGTPTGAVTQPAPTTTVTTTAPPPPSPAPENSAPASSSDGGSPQILFNFSGTGDQNTSSFTAPDTWHLSWAYWGCPNPPANFTVSEYNTDGTPDLNGINVNELGSGRGPVATTAYGDGGTHYFQVVTEGCSWQLVVVSGSG